MKKPYLIIFFFTDWKESRGNSVEKSPKPKIFQIQVGLLVEQEEKRNKTKATDGSRKCIGSPQGRIRAPHIQIPSVQFSSVAQSCLTLCGPMNRSTPGLPVHHQLPEFTQTHIHRVSDAIQPSHPLASPSPPAPNPSQHQSLFQ